LQVEKRVRKGREGTGGTLIAVRHLVRNGTNESVSGQGEKKPNDKRGEDHSGKQGKKGGSNTLLLEPV